MFVFSVDTKVTAPQTFRLTLENATSLKFSTRWVSASSSCSRRPGPKCPEPSLSTTGTALSATKPTHLDDLLSTSYAATMATSSRATNGTKQLPMNLSSAFFATRPNGTHNSCSVISFKSISSNNFSPNVEQHWIDGLRAILVLLQLTTRMMSLCTTASSTAGLSSSSGRR